MKRRLPPNEQSRGLASKSRYKTCEHDSCGEHCLSRESPGYYFEESVLRPECSSRWLWSDVFSTWTSSGGCMDGGILDFLCEEKTLRTVRSYWTKHFITGDKMEKSSDEPPTDQEPRPGDQADQAHRVLIARSISFVSPSLLLRISFDCLIVD